MTDYVADALSILAQVAVELNERDVRAIAKGILANTAEPDRLWGDVIDSYDEWQTAEGEIGSGIDGWTTREEALHADDLGYEHEKAIVAASRAQHAAPVQVQVIAA